MKRWLSSVCSGAAAVALVIACGGTNGPGGGSALCGPNGTNACKQGLTCDPTYGCVQCVGDGNCPASAPRCLLGDCVACATNG
ncbi:MAG TPA: hypothetical protein VLM85_04130, partial [Polyangiaceae bacterium]|nr:hypothetical protein [Polyangiaceae bacterium]